MIWATNMKPCWTWKGKQGDIICQLQYLDVWVRMMNSHQKDVCTLCQMAWPICAMVKPYGIFMGYGHPTIINKGFIVLAIWTPIYRFIPIPQYRHWIPGPRHHGQPCREKKKTRDLATKGFMDPLKQEFKRSQKVCLPLFLGLIFDGLALFWRELVVSALQNVAYNSH